MLRIRQDKPLHEANTLQDLEALLAKRPGPYDRLDLTPEEMTQIVNATVPIVGICSGCSMSDVVIQSIGIPTRSGGRSGSGKYR